MFVAFGAVCIFYLIFTWDSAAAGFMGDDAIYLLLADIFSPYTTTTILHEHIKNVAFFPQFYPIILGTFGGGSEHLATSHFITTIIFLIGLAIYYFWLKSESCPSAHAGALILFFAILPATMFLSLEIWSEWLYLLLVWSTLLAANKGKQTGEWLLFAAFCAGLTYFTRRVGLSLVAAFVIYLLIIHYNRKLYALLLASIPILVDHLLFPRGEQTSYLTVFVQKQDESLVQSILKNVLNQLSGLWPAWEKSLTLIEHPLFTAGCAVIAISGLIGLSIRLYNKKLDAIYFVSNFLILLIWPFPDHIRRIFFILIPLFSFYAYYPLRTVFQGWFIQNKILTVYSLLCMITVLPSSYLIISRLFQSPITESLAPYKHTRYWLRTDSERAIKDIRFKKALVENTRLLRDLVPESDCIYSIHPQITMLYSRRISLHPPTKETDDNYWKSHTSTCNYFLIYPFASGSKFPIMYPYDRIRPYTTDVQVFRIDNSNKDSDLVAVLLRKTSKFKKKYYNK